MPLLQPPTLLGERTRVRYPSVPPVTLTIHLRRLVALVSTITAQDILLRIVESGSETREDRQNQVVAVNGGQGRGNQGNQARGRAFMLGEEEARQDPNIVTGSDASPTPTPFSEKLALVTHHHLLTRVPVKLDLDDWNFGQWEFFFKELCASYEVNKYLRSPINETSACSLAPLTPEETKVDKIVLSWILFTLSDSLRARIVVARPKSAKEAWSLISDTVKDNKRSRTNTLKADVNEEDVVHYALEGLPDTYNQVCGYMHWKDTFPDLNAVRSLLIAEELRLKSKVLASPMDSSSLMVFVAGSSNNSRPSSMAQGKSWKPCFNFDNGNCYFGDTCRYVHDANARVPNATSGIHKGREASDNSTHDLLNKLITQLGNMGMNMSSTSSGSNATVSPSIGPTTTPSRPIAYYASPSLTGPTTPLEFTMPAHVPVSYPTGPAVPAFYCSAGPLPDPTAQLVQHIMHHLLLGIRLWVRPKHLNQDPSTGAWNMDTGANSHLNNSVTSLSTVLNSCMYSTVSVGDGRSIPVTNTGHNILPTPLKSLRLNDVLITPYIDFMTRRVLLRCDSTGDLYPVTAPSPIPHAFLVSQHMWHHHLGHPGSDVLRRLVSNNVISCNKKKPPILCHVCQLDHYSQFVWVYPLVRKSDVLSKFILFRNYVRTQFKCEIRAFQCDHGGEFDNRNLHDLFNTHGIQFRFSCPKTSQQNGKSERMVLTLNNIIRTLLFQAKLEPSYWVEALHMAVHILNILPSTAINNEVPFTRLFGTSPDYSLLRTFGCLCYPHLYPNHKLEPRATPSLFLGHASNHRGYRCLDLTTNKNIISRHVTFDETVFLYGSTPSTTIPSYTFLDEPDINPPSVSVSTFQPPVHEPTTPPTNPTHSAQSPITPIIDESAHTAQSNDHVTLSSPNSAQHAPTIIPDPLPC
ncbi:ribonuclease H-like domain-containing protein [Tanacetum coccineum]